MASERLVHGLARATMLAALVLVVLGGLVTSRDAGLAVPDWPLAFGELNPPRWWTIVNVRTEHSHRIVAFCVASLVAVLAWFVHRHEPRRHVRRLATAAAALVLLQALLGGLRVLALSIDLAMVHGWLGQIFFATLVALAVVTGPTWRDAEADGHTALGGGLAAAAGTLVALIVVQLVVGIWIRHLGESVRPLIAHPIFYVHIAVGLAVAVSAFDLGGRVRRAVPPANLGKAALALQVAVCVQILLGFAAFLVTEPMAYDRQATMLESWLPTLHVATGAAVLGLAVALAMHAVAGSRVQASARLTGAAG